MATPRWKKKGPTLHLKEATSWTACIKRASYGQDTWQPSVIHANYGEWKKVREFTDELKAKKLATGMLKIVTQFRET